MEEENKKSEEISRMFSDEKGQIARIRGRGHINTRLYQFRGPKLMDILREQALKKGVKLVERIMITDLLTSDGLHPTQAEVVGAIGFHPRTMDWHGHDYFSPNNRDVRWLQEHASSRRQ